jgi:hypothetical protein
VVMVRVLTVFDPVVSVVVVAAAVAQTAFA